jgi:acyl carrier protein
MKRSVGDEVIAIVSRAAERPPASVTPETALASLGFGSLDQIECLLALEDALQVEISEADARNLRTVQDVIDAAQRAIAARRPSSS